MSGYSGSSVASHTPLLRVGDAVFGITVAQMTLVRRTKCTTMRTTPVRSIELRSAHVLANLKLGRVYYDEERGERFFELVKGVEILQLGRLP
jgi:hypothetical protein